MASTMLAQAIVEFFKYKVVSSIIILACWKPTDQIKFTRELSQFGMSSTFSCDPGILDHIRHHYLQGVIYMTHKHDDMLMFKKGLCTSHFLNAPSTRVLVCIAIHVRLHRVCFATQAREVCKGSLQAVSNVRAYRVCIATNARRRRVKNVMKPIHFMMKYKWLIVGDHVPDALRKIRYDSDVAFLECNSVMNNGTRDMAVIASASTDEAGIGLDSCFE
uniref:SFRICE_002734 n=1 Tax=Spodoptera frugiperda TaxID=7108 RepID=A0A2H1V7D4_SPOFR